MVASLNQNSVTTATTPATSFNVSDIVHALPNPDPAKTRLEGIPPLVSQDKVTDHLLILGAFHKFLQPISNQGEEHLRYVLNRATYRLQLWLEKIISIKQDQAADTVIEVDRRSILDHELPPLDVAIALHSLMLSPHRFYEDSQVRLPQLQRIGDYPLGQLASVIDRETFDIKYTPAQRKYWTNRTGLAFDPIDSLLTDKERSFICPVCDETFTAPWKNRGCGFAEVNFSQTCPSCRTVITHDHLRVGKFLCALRSFKEDNARILPNTGGPTTGDMSMERARAVANEVLRVIKPPDNILSLVTELSMADIEKKLRNSPETKLRTESIPLLLRAFEHSYVFTQDLVQAMEHQWNFTQLVWPTGWCTNGFPSFQDVYNRYCIFLASTATSEQAVIPKTDVDTIWHTHQLVPMQYRLDTVKYFEVFPDHLPHWECVGNTFAIVCPKKCAACQAKAFKYPGYLKDDSAHHLTLSSSQIVDH